MAYMNVNYTQLATFATSILSGLEDLDNSVARAAAAGESAVAAGGGASTGVGSAIQNSIAGFPLEQYKEARKVINGLVSALTEVSSTYQKADSNLIEQIKAIKQSADALQTQGPQAGEPSSVHATYYTAN